VRHRPLIGDHGQADGEEDQGADHEEAHAPLLQVRQLRLSLRPPLLPGSPRKWAAGSSLTLRCSPWSPQCNTVSRESVDNRSNERSLPIDLVRDGRTRPVAGSIASRNPGPSTSAQWINKQISQ
jgi:hypothetical protein